MRFDDLTALTELPPRLSGLPAFDAKCAEAARARQMELTKPPGSLGRLEELAIFMAGWQRTARPRIAAAQALVFAGNHGICVRGVNPFPQEVTAGMVANFTAGGAAINQLCAVSGASLTAIPLELDRPTADFTEGPAMTAPEALAALDVGRAAVDADASVLILGEMGIGNSTTAAALAHATLGGTAEDWVGRGTGADPDVMARKVDTVRLGAKRHGGQPPLQAMANLGGRELAAIAGAVLAARAARIPVILDGFICTAAVLPLWAPDPDLLSRCLVARRSAEPGPARMLEAIGQRPILDLGMALGEGSGAAVALGVLRAAVACHDGMATFAEAGLG